jgi:hypothetical protein
MKIKEPGRESPRQAIDMDNLFARLDCFHRGTCFFSGRPLCAMALERGLLLEALKTVVDAHSDSQIHAE